MVFKYYSKEFLKSKLADNRFTSNNLNLYKKAFGKNYVKNYRERFIIFKTKRDRMKLIAHFERRLRRSKKLNFWSRKNPYYMQLFRIWGKNLKGVRKVTKKYFSDGSFYRKISEGKKKNRL